jgi:hypothetical protein
MGISEQGQELNANPQILLPVVIDEQRKEVRDGEKKTCSQTSTTLLSSESTKTQRQGPRPKCSHKERNEGDGERKLSA